MAPDRPGPGSGNGGNLLGCGAVLRGEVQLLLRLLWGLGDEVDCETGSLPLDIFGGYIGRCPSEVAALLHVLGQEHGGPAAVAPTGRVVVFPAPAPGAGRP